MNIAHYVVDVVGYAFKVNQLIGNNLGIDQSG